MARLEPLSPSGGGATARDVPAAGMSHAGTGSVCRVGPQRRGWQQKLRPCAQPGAVEAGQLHMSGEIPPALQQHCFSVC